MTTAEHDLSESTRLLELLESLILPTDAEKEMIKNLGIKRDHAIQLLEERRNSELFKQDQTSIRLAVRRTRTTGRRNKTTVVCPQDKKETRSRHRARKHRRRD